RRHTRSKRDWSSDVCSSDLFSQFKLCVDETQMDDDSDERCPNAEVRQSVLDLIGGYADDALDMVCGEFGINGQKCLELLKSGKRSEERRVGKESRSKGRSRE